MQTWRTPDGGTEYGLREVVLTPPEPDDEEEYDDEGTDLFDRFLLDGFE